MRPAKRPVADMTIRWMLVSGLVCGALTALQGYLVIPALDDTFDPTPLAVVVMGVWVGVFMVLWWLAVRTVARRRRMSSSEP